ncbi:Nitrate reductase gamma subunit [Archaeoglobus sulfaticallidus PM70-1]|uniref:Nitrate reductase gamma subunit n=1 Tax=Archaeoglobus sulfaticallidus PM70-1 TaxID=387631 RepID=N0BNJ6_9EURY|nr:sulfate reduction electron transfer complex DsrMKJOP subunit DsrM [Archaeoglobus sulfaticallidus]AGK62241.1 Nitrate reductase gamma subunit [Archaeoglobus sulfaticallidus PM70-1]
MSLIGTVVGVYIPYIAAFIFVVGVLYRVFQWSRSAVPFNITTTCGQQYSLPWLKRTWIDRFDSPFTWWETVIRMLMEIFLFRSLWKNVRYELPAQKAVSTKWLWVFGLVFHWSLLIVLIRHFRFFLEPVPWFVSTLMKLDGFFEVHMDWFQPHMTHILITGLTLLVALLYLLYRRLAFPKERTFSLPSDYIALILLLGVATTGLLMRYVYPVDVSEVKALAQGLLSFHPPANPDLDLMFMLHLLFVSTLLAYFPFSKLMHSAGIFFSPTRNMPNNCRAKRHVNPWNYPVKGVDWNEFYENFKDDLDEIEQMGFVVRPEEY